MTQYTALDERIVAAIKAGKRPLYDSFVSVEARRIAEASGREEMRIIDGRVQALRKAGRIAADRKTDSGWVIVAAAKPLKTDQVAVAENVMVEAESEIYRAANGFTARRESGLTPNGNPVGDRWVLRDSAGSWVDFDQNRHDLFERNGLKPNY